MKIALFFGGRSEEHAVSVRSAHSLAKLLAERGIDPFLVGIDRGGRLYRFPYAPDLLHPDTWVRHAIPVTLIYHGGVPFSLMDGEGQKFTPDYIISVLHGKYGEDGAWQGFFDLAAIPFAGCGTLSSALCMHKGVAKELAAYHGIPTASFLLLRAPLISAVEEKFAYPVFVKPVSSGSSLGASLASNRSELEKALALAFSYSEEALVEEYIHGSELEVAVLERDDALLVSAVGEISVSSPFYDYHTKYQEGSAQIRLPSPLGEEELSLVESMAKRLFRIFRCRGFARIDFLRRGEREIYFNEVNTLPGMTDTSLFPWLIASVCGDPLAFLPEVQDDRGI